MQPRKGAPGPDRGPGDRGVHPLRVARACARPVFLVALAVVCAFAPAAASDRRAGGKDTCAEGEDNMHHAHACSGQPQRVGAICGDMRSLRASSADQDGEQQSFVRFAAAARCGFARVPCPACGVHVCRSAPGRAPLQHWRTMKDEGGRGWTARGRRGSIARRCSLSAHGDCKRLTWVDSYRRHLSQQQHARPPLRAGSVRRNPQQAWLHATLGRTHAPGKRRRRCRLARVHAAQGQTENTTALAAPARACSSCRHGRAVRGGVRGQLLHCHATSAQGASEQAVRRVAGRSRPAQRDARARWWMAPWAPGRA